MKNKFTLKMTLILIFMVNIVLLKAQDYITLANGTFYKVRIVELNSVEIKYRPFNGSTDQLYSIARNQVYNIRYENGMIDFLNGKTVWPKASANLTNVETFKSSQSTATATTPTVAKIKSTPSAASSLGSSANVKSAAANPVTSTADLSKLNLTPEQMQTLMNMLNSNVAATTNEQQTATNPTTPLPAQSIAQSILPAQQVQPENTVQANNQTASTITSNPYNALISNTLVAKQQTTSTGSTKRPTAFRNYMNHIDFGGITEYDEFIGLSLLGESSIGKSDFGLAVDGSFVGDSYSDIGLRLSYHIPLTTYFDPYIAVRGFYYDDTYYDDKDVDSDFIMGGRLMLKKFGVFYEYHFNYEFAKFGLSFSF